MKYNLMFSNYILMLMVIDTKFRPFFGKKGLYPNAWVCQQDSTYFSIMPFLFVVIASNRIVRIAFISLGVFFMCFIHSPCC